MTRNTRRDILPMMTQLSHKDRAARRKKIAAYCRKHTIEEASREFGVSISTVKLACSEHGVATVNETPVKVRDGHLSLIADLISTRTSYATLARRRGVTRQAVAQLAGRCAEAGIPVKER